MERGGSSTGKGVARSGSAGKEKRAKNGENSGMKRDPDQYMPISRVNGIMRRVLPEEAKVTDEAKEAIQECVSEFIAFITKEANERCNSEYRRTITPNDVISTMAALGFNDYVEPLTVFLNNHRAQEYPSRPPMPLPLPVPVPVRHPPPAVARQPPRQMDFFPPPPPPPPPAAEAPPVVAYVPSPPMISDDYFDLPQMRDYFMDSQYGGGEGSEFDPFN